jgi:hypothetical protein
MRYRLKTIEFVALHGFFSGRHSLSELYADTEPRPATVEFTGTPACDVDNEWDEADLEVVRPEGTVIGRYSMWSVRAWRNGDVVTVRGRCGTAPHVDAEALWREWSVALPAARGLWARLPVGSREAWLDVAEHHYWATAEPAPRQDRAELDGQDVEDLASFFCAIGEAVRGPGGYLGSSFGALTDSLATERGLSLTWTDFDVARRSLATEVETGAGRMSYLDIALWVLNETGVKLIPL